MRRCDGVSVDGVPVVRESSGHRHVLLHKPVGCLTTTCETRRCAHDPRRTVYDYVDAETRRRHCLSIGRLDFNTSGALLFTTDGVLAHALLDPAQRVSKVYHATLRPSGRDAVADPLSPAELRLLSVGVVLPASKGKPARLAAGAATNLSVGCSLELHGGAYHQVKVMFSAIGRSVDTLHRVSFAGVGVESLAPGESRELRLDEVELLYRQARRQRDADP